MRIQLSHTFEDIISVENLLAAWQEFIKGKRSKRDVQEFALHLMDNIFELHRNLIALRYRHSGYKAFNICDPKPRNIHKASVRDRLLHHALYRTLYPFFDRIFIADSFSCRLNMGTHRARKRFRAFAYKVSKNNTRTCWILKCDIRKFFANIDHEILKQILKSYIPDQKILWLLNEVVDSFSTEGKPHVGLPLGNLTSQLLVNVYMNEFDQFMKHKAKTKYYARYSDDFVALADTESTLKLYIPMIRDFLKARLKLELHPNKLSIETIASGSDFLGWVHFTDHTVLRGTTRRRMMKKLKQNPSPETLTSYRGLLAHGNARKLERRIDELVEN